MLALENSSEDIKKNFLAGHSCGDELDLDENGRPQMALRISFGYHNSTKDVLKLVGFFEEFVKRSNLQENQGRELKFQLKNFHLKIYLEKDVESSNKSEPVRLQSLYVFPLKSAGALSCNKMRFHDNGTPLLTAFTASQVEHLGRLFRESICRNWRKSSRDWIRRNREKLGCIILALKIWCWKKMKKKTMKMEIRRAFLFVRNGKKRAS